VQRELPIEQQPFESGSPKYEAEARAEYGKLGIRSKLFKAWFGDWEHDPENASKVVDEKGEPKENYPILSDSQVVDEQGEPVAVYHGTGAEFSTFKKPDVDWIRTFGAGIYFTEDVGIANEYTQYAKREGKGDQSHVIKAYLNVRHPLDGDAPVSRVAIERIIETFGQYVLERKNQDNGVKAGMNALEAGRQWLGYLIEGNTGLTGTQLWNGFSRDVWDMSDGTMSANDVLARAGYDGITYIGGDIVDGGSHSHRAWIAFEPNQIKAIDNQGTFNPDDDDIYKAFGAQGVAGGGAPTVSQPGQEGEGAEGQDGQQEKGQPQQPATLPPFQQLTAKAALAQKEIEGGIEELELEKRRIEAQLEVVNMQLDRARTTLEHILDSGKLDERLAQRYEALIARRHELVVEHSLADQVIAAAMLGMDSGLPPITDTDAERRYIANNRSGLL
jgi:hypothetical protein